MFIPASNSFRNQTINSRTTSQYDFEGLLLCYFAGEAIMSARETAELLLLVGRLVQAEGYDGELSPAQWMALRYFARANQYSRNPSAFAEFQATTRGTASLKRPTCYRRTLAQVIEAGEHISGCAYAMR
jgi:hypothetical protein